MKKQNETVDRGSRIRLIEISTDLFLEKGFAGTSMSAIAAAADMTKASLYYHFDNKEDLFIACVTDGYQSALDALREISADPVASPEKKLGQAFETLYETMIHSTVGRMSPLIAEVSRTFPAVAQSFHREYVVPQQGFLQSIIAQGVADGVFRQVDEKVLSHLVFGPMVTLSLSREMFTSFDDLDAHFPVGALKDGHLEAVLTLLSAE